MRSFSSFKPVQDGTPTETKSKIFAMWLRANAHNVRAPFSRATWRTARPWLSFNDIRYQLKLFRDRSLGSINVAGIQLKNNDVEQAVKYEAYATRQICSHDVREMVLEFYDYSRMNEIPKSEVMDTINREFAYMNRGHVTSRDRSWKQGIDSLAERGICMLKPKITEHKLADLIMELYTLGGEDITSEDVYHSVLPFLNNMGESLHTASPILRRALHITGHKLTFKNHRQFIEDTVRKYYVEHRLGNEPLERLQYIVNLKHAIPATNKIWEVIDLHIVPKHDFKSNEYEICLNKKYHHPPIVTPMQVPFMKYILPHNYIRKKQNIPWRWIFKMCTRSKGTTTDTLNTLNYIIEKNGFIPYDHAHPEFDRLKIQGLSLQNLSCASLRRSRVRFPPSLKRKRPLLRQSEQYDNEDAQHSDE